VKKRRRERDKEGEGERKRENVFVFFRASLLFFPLLTLVKENRKRMTKSRGLINEQE